MLTAKNSGKRLGGRGSAANPAGGAHSAPSDPLAGGRGLAAPLKNPAPLSAFCLDFRRVGLVPMKNTGHVTHALGTVCDGARCGAGGRKSRQVNVC